MAKLSTLFMLLIAVQAVLVLYHGQTATNTDLWSFVTNIQNWNSLTFLLGFIGIAGAMGLTGIVVGSVFGFKTDFIVFAGAISGLLSMGIVFVNLANVMGSFIAPIFMCSGSSWFDNCDPAVWLIAITIGPIAFYYVWTVVEWWRGKDN